MSFQPAARVATFGTSVFTEVTELAARHQAKVVISIYQNTTIFFV